MSRRVLGIRRGNSVQERIQNPVQDVDGLRLIPTTDVVDKAIITVEDQGLFRFDYEGIGVDDGALIVQPTTGPGRWFLLAGSFAATLQDIERLRHPIPVVANTELKARDWVWSAMTVTRIDVLLLDAVVTAGAYTLAISGAGNNLLSLATVNLLGLVPGTVTELPLTGTALDLQLLDKDPIVITVNSDNADLSGGKALLVTVYVEETGGFGGGGGGGETLAETLALGFVTGANDIQVDPAQAVKGTPAAAASGLAGSPLNLRGGLGDGAGLQGRVLIEPAGQTNGLFLSGVDGFSDPHVLDVQAGEGIIYVDDGTSLQADTPYYVGDPGTFFNWISLFGGDVVTTAFNSGIAILPTMRRGHAGLTGPITNSSIVLPSLPLANTCVGRIIWFEHQGDGTGSLTVNAIGGDTIDGIAGLASVPLGEFKAFISDGVSDWRTIKFPGGGGGISGPGAVTAVNQVALWTDGTGTAVKESTMTVVGNDANVVGTLSAAEVVAGDLILRSEERDALWRMIEHHDFIQVVNETTGKKFRLHLIPEEDS